MKPIRSILFIAVSIFFILIPIGCGSSPSIEETNANLGLVTGVAPTVNSIFAPPTRIPTNTPLPTATPVPSLTPTPPIDVETIVIFDDAFDPRWTFEAEGAFVEIVDEASYTGDRLLKISPREPFSDTYIITRPNNTQPFEREKIIRISFFINSPTLELDPRDLSIRSQGSNDLTYWDEDDRSAILTQDLVFLDSQLTFFDISSIPQDTWLPIEFSPEDLEFDPNYANYTGFIFTSNEPELAPIYIDRIEIEIERE
ncbi:MAG: hypothetical protein AAF633_09430 [Chloroflexota bacterium]